MQIVQPAILKAPGVPASQKTHHVSIIKKSIAVYSDNQNTEIQQNFSAKCQVLEC
jgi:hypothetical protein